MTAIIWVAGGLAALSALGVVFSPQPLYSALSLVLAIGALAVIFLVLNAQFLFVVQLIVYAGAVMVLFVFIIALLSPDREERVRVDLRFLLGALVAIGITVTLLVAARNGITYNANGFRAQQIGQASDPYHTFSFDQSDNGLVNTAGNVQTVGGQLFTTFLLPFEITSLLLLVSAIGAVYLTRRRHADTATPRREPPLARARDHTAAEERAEQERIEVETG